jgi:hypothetical protein
VISTFSGTPTNTGIYVTTFFAGDKDGTNSQTIVITVKEGGCESTNLITEGFDASTSVPAGWINGGTANNTQSSHYQSSPNCRALGSGDTLQTPAVSLPTQLIFYIDSSSPGAGHTASVDYKVNGGAWTQIGAFIVSSTGSNATFKLNSTPDLSTTTNVTFRFNSAFNTWYLDDVRITGLNCSGGAPADTPPILNPISDQSAVVGNTLQFSVTATPTEGDPVTLTVSNAPAGSYFTSTGENGMFYWTNASPVGVYTTTFYAADIGGVDFEQILITVVEASGGGGGGTETFTNVNAPAATYGSGSYVGDNVIQWNYTGARTPDSSYDVDGQTIGFGDSTRNPRQVYSSTIAGGVGDLSVKYRKYFTGAGTRSFDIYVNSNLVGSVSDANNTNSLTFATNGVNIAGNVVIRIVGTGGREFIVDTLSWSGYAPVNPDSNSNGIPDVWEDANFGNRTNTADGDNDGDGFSNYREYVADTCPTNFDSRFELDAILNPDGRQVSFWATNTRQYSVEYVPALPFEGPWSNLQVGLPGTNGYLQVTDTNEAERRIYRGRVTLP